MTEVKKTLFTAESIEDIEKCLQNGANINEINYSGETPFISHCIKNNIDIVLALVERGCNVTNRTYPFTYNKNGLDFICNLGHIFLLESLLKYPKIVSLINPIDNFHHTPLMWACHKGNTDIFDLLIKNNADINAENYYGYTPLILSCVSNQIDSVHRLLNNGVDVNYRNIHGKSAIFYVDNENILNHLLVYNANINIQDNVGNTPIMDIISTRPNLAQKLILYGANLNLWNDYYYTPLMLASRGINIDIVKLLLAHGADPLIENKWGNNSIDLAIVDEIKDILCLNPIQS